MLKSIRLRNLRGFTDNQDLPFIDLKPITVFVGKNSSGKSTLLRSLPLLRQSVEARTTGPILWYGSYVDFGAFSEAISHNAKENTIYFDFKLELNIPSNPYSRYDNSYHVMIGKDKVTVLVELGVTDIKNKTIAKSLKIKLGNYDYQFDFLNDGKCNFTINGDNVEDLDILDFYLPHGNFLPIVGRIKKIERTIDGEKRTRLHWQESYLNTFFKKALISKLRKYFRSNTSDETIYEGLAKIGICEPEDIESNFKHVFKTSKTFKKKFKCLTAQDIQSIHSFTMHQNLNLILNLIDREVISTFKNVRYIAPLRATAERYYRHQDLQIDEIDHTGSNLAMLLKSWSSKENLNFSTWTMHNFGFKVRVNESGLHYALMIETKGDQKEYNINDMGFGFSQILPIVASIWLETMASNNRKRRYNSRNQLIFTIEQPELHLHPEYQSKLATMFSTVIQIAKDKNIQLSIIFETHSKTMIDTLGDNVEDGIINKDDINIVLFEKCQSTNSSLVKFATYDDDGNLDNWPFGFFSGRSNVTNH